MKRILCVAICALLFSCSDKKIPDDVLPRDKMIEVLIDIHLAEAAITIQQMYGEIANQKAADYYDWIFREHDITKEQFRISFDYYTAHPELFKEIYDELIVKMSEREPQLKKYIKDNLQKMDSAQKEMNDSLTILKYTSTMPNDSSNSRHLDSVRKKLRKMMPVHRPRVRKE